MDIDALRLLRETTSAIGGVLFDDCVILYECRRCGTTVDSKADRCPHCETDEVARYEIR